MKERFAKWKGESSKYTEDANAKLKRDANKHVHVLLINMHVHKLDLDLLGLYFTLYNINWTVNSPRFKAEEDEISVSPSAFNPTRVIFFLLAHIVTTKAGAFYES